MDSKDVYNMYVYDLPYKERKEICRILDVNKFWERLGGCHMGIDVYTLKHFEEAPCRNHSPTDELLTFWGTRNHTVLELYVLLSRMQHYQAMMVLKPLVHKKYHTLIYEGEENLSEILKRGNMNAPCSSIPAEENKKEMNRNSDINFNGTENPPIKIVQKCKLPPDDKVVNDKDISPIAGASSKNKHEDALSPSISYSELEEATGSWDRRNILGRGGFGTVYKGVWKNTKVAIKRLEIQKEKEMDENCKIHRKQSLQELKCLNCYRHDNILPLYGYSIGGPHDCLVYQYMTNGSLEDRLLCREDTKPLTWAQRHVVATGTARGLQYLHNFGDKPLVHGDIKSANILLDPYFEPKIGDFGLAREGPLQQYTHIKISRVHGTRPYLPDEFLRAKKLSTKVDTYSFGVVLFELVTGLRAYDESRSHRYLKDHVESYAEDKRSELTDVKAGYDNGISSYSLLSLGYLCVSIIPKNRPEMVGVLMKLDEIKRNYEISQQTQPAEIYLRSHTPGLLYNQDHLRRFSPNAQSHSPNAISPIGLGIFENIQQVEPQNSISPTHTPGHYFSRLSPRHMNKVHQEQNACSISVNQRVDGNIAGGPNSSNDIIKNTKKSADKDNDHTPEPSSVLIQNSGDDHNNIPLISTLGI